MLAYIVRRLLLIIPTLIGIMVINFVIVQAAPGGPIEQMLAQLQGTGVDATARIGGTSGGSDLPPQAQQSGGGEQITGRYRGAQGLDPEFIKQLEKQFGFDKPMHERFLQMMGNYLVFDFGTSYFRDQRVVDLVLDKMPVSISLGLMDDADRLPDLHPAGHPQGGEGRLEVRHLDQRRRHRRLRHPQLPVRRAADRAVLRRPLSGVVPLARTDQRGLGLHAVVAADPGLFLAHHPAGGGAGDRRFRRT